MPRRDDIHSILIIGSGPIVIGQGCEFDYSGVQACRALKEEGYRVVLINSNPATIMTDPEFADATYIEPITPECVEKILDREQKQGTPIDAVLPTLGGQTGLNTAMACFDKGIFPRFNVKMIGANREAIFKGEDRKVFKDLMLKIGLKVPRSGVVHTLDEGRKVLDEIGLPLIIRPAFTLGGTGGGIAYNVEEFDQTVQRGLDASPVTEVLIEQSVIGWKEYELEVMRDRNDNVVIICSIENMDAMGVHTGDSITVAPVQTLTDKEYQRMRDAAIAVIRAVGVETGGSNIQFAVNPANGEMIVVEMNPRVSRSSALASKATGYPIAKMAAKLAVGYTLDELSNDITTRKRPTSPSSNPQSAIPNPQSDYDLHTSACFEPTIDYCVIKIPRWTFEKFPDADETLTTQMKSVGEAMAIGRTFKEALQKGIRSMEVKRFGFGLDRYDKWLNSQRGTGFQPVQHGLETHATANDKTTQGESLDHEWPIPEEKLTRKLAVPSQGRLYYLRYAMQMGWTLDRIHKLTGIDPWFLNQMKELTDFETQLFAASKHVRHPWSKEIIDLVRQAKQWGYSDVQLANVWNMSPSEFRSLRMHVMKPVYKLVDTCAAEFEATTPYYYSTYELPYHRLPLSPSPGTPGEGRGEGIFSPTEREVGPAGSNQVVDDEIRLTDKPKVIIIGGGPNRIGQGIEFDYCCVQAAFAMKELGLESVMVNSNPETVSTDYDTSDLLFFEPLTHEDILNICERLNGGPFNRKLHIHPDDELSASERATLERELKDRDLLPAAVMKVMRAESKPGADSAFLLFSAGTWARIAVLSPDSQLREWIDDASSYAKDAIYRDADASSRLDWWNRCGHFVKGVIVQFGGQTPLNLAKGLAEAGVPIIGTSVESLDLAGDREQFRTFLQKLGLKQPENGIARNISEAREIAKRIGYPVLVRPSFVLGGRAMEIVSDEEQLNYYMTHAVEASTIKDAPILVDKFLDNATEVDVDCLADFDPAPQLGTRNPELGTAVIIGVMEHIEEAGIHSGDSACALPPYSLSKEIVARLKDQTRALACALRVNGLMNVQYAIKDNDIYVIEVNPRASRTVPFVSKATGISWAKIAAKVMAGKSLAELGVKEQPDPKHTSVKEVVFPFTKFPGVDVILGPEMRSTGEVMGIDNDFPLAFAKSQIAAGSALPTKGSVFISVNDRDKSAIIPIAKALRDSGFELLTSSGTHDALAASGIVSRSIAKLSEGRPNLKDYIKNAGLQLIINTPTRKGPQTDEGKIRALAVLNRVPIVTTLAGALAASKAIRALQRGDWSVKPLQAYHTAK